MNTGKMKRTAIAALLVALVAPLLSGCIPAAATGPSSRSRVRGERVAVPGAATAAAADRLT